MNKLLIVFDVESIDTHIVYTYSLDENFTQLEYALQCVNVELGLSLTRDDMNQALTALHNRVAWWFNEQYCFEIASYN